MMVKECNDSPSDSPLGDMGGDGKLTPRQERGLYFVEHTGSYKSAQGNSEVLLRLIWQTLEDINEALRESRRSPADDLVGEIAMEALRIYRPGDAL